MKNKKLLVYLAVAIFTSISVAIAQQAPVKITNENKAPSKAEEVPVPKMMVAQVPTIATDSTMHKAITPAMASSPAVAPVLFKVRPAEMSNLLPKEDVKPVMPSTLAKPVAAPGLKPAVPKTAAMPKQADGPKVAPVQ
ncbi:MAG: hypothetical protein V4722_07480 [Bacteroidota bacterium]